MGTLRATVAGVVLAGLTAAVAGAETGRPAECEAQLVPDRLTLSPRPVRILVETPRPIGELHDVTPNPRSGISILRVEEDRPRGSAWILELDLRDASPGDWTLTLDGAEAECVGRLQLREAGNRG